MVTTTDEALLPSAHAGDERAAAVLIDRYWPLGYRVALRVTGDPSGAEDAVQEALVKVFRRAQQFDPQRGSFKSWFLRAVTNTARNQQRSRHRRRRHEEHAARTESAEGPSDQVQWVLEELSRLEPDLKAAVTLKHVANMSYREVGEAMGWPEGTAVHRVRRGLEVLRERMRPGVTVAGVSALAGLIASPAEAAPAAPSAADVLAEAGISESSPGAAATGAASFLPRALAVGLVAALALTLAAVLAPEDDPPGAPGTRDAARADAEEPSLAGEGSDGANASADTTNADAAGASAEADLASVDDDSGTAHAPDAAAARLTVRATRGGAPIAGAEVLVLPLARPRHFPTTRGDWLGERGGVLTTTDAEGLARFDTVTEGKGGTVVFARHGLDWDKTTLHAPGALPAQLDLNLRAAPRPERGTLTLTLRGPAGKAIADTPVLVRCGLRDRRNFGHSYQWMVETIRTDADGRLTLHDLLEGQHTFTVWPREGGWLPLREVRQSLLAGEALQRTLSVEPGRTVRGAVELPPGSQPEELVFEKLNTCVRLEAPPGEWALGGVPAKGLDFVARVAGHFPREIVLEPGGEDGPTISFEGRTISGRLLEADGTPAAAGSEVWLSHRSNRFSAVARCDAEGRFSFRSVPPDRYVLSYPARPKQIRLTMEDEDLWVGDVRRAGDTHRGLVGGRVVDAQGRGVQAEVAGWYAFYDVDGHRTFLETVRTDTDGRFRFPEPITSRWLWLSARSPDGQTMSGLQRFDTPAGFDPDSGATVTLRPAAVLSGRVVRAEGDARQLEVFYRDRGVPGISPDDSVWHQVAAPLSADDTFRLVVPPSKGTVFVRESPLADWSELPYQDVEVGVGETAQVRIDASSRSERLEVELGGLPFEIDGWALLGLIERRNRDVLLLRGKARFDAIPTGRYTVELNFTGPGTAQFRPFYTFTAPVEVRRGATNALRFEWPQETGVLVGKLAKPPSAMSYVLVTHSHGRAQVNVGLDGRFRLPHIPPGRHEVQVHGHPSYDMSDRSVSVEIVTGQETVLPVR